MPDLTTFNSPGVYVRETTWGVIPQGLSNHASAYILGSSLLGPSPKNTPTFCDSFNTFTNIFGSNSPSASAVKAYFEQRSGVGIWFTAVRTNARNGVALTAAYAASTDYTITINSVNYNFRSPATGGTAATVLTGLGALINNYTSGSWIQNATLVAPVGATVTATPNLTLTPVVAPGTPDIQDVRYAINSSFDADSAQGFLFAPEFFRAFTNAAHITELQQAMEALASDPQFNWIAIIDSSLATATAVNSSEFVRLSTIERSTMSSVRGHSCLYTPYLTYEGVATPPSPFVVATAIRAQREYGLRQPPASLNLPLRGVSGVSQVITRQLGEVLNPLGINCIRQFPNNGYCIYGARTLSTNKFYTFYLVRLVFNILAASLETAYANLVLTSVDGLGTTFATVVGTGASVCEQLRRAGALYGSSPDQAYRVICDSTNNPGIDLDLGKLSVEVIAVPTATMEVIGITLARASIGSPLVEAVRGVVNTAQVAVTPTASR